MHGSPHPPCKGSCQQTQTPGKPQVLPSHLHGVESSGSLRLGLMYQSGLVFPRLTMSYRA